MKQMTPAAVERAMKLQDVMLRAMAKRITWYQAAREDWCSQIREGQGLAHLGATRFGRNTRLGTHHSAVDSIS